MKESVIRKLEGLQERYEEVQALMGEPSVINDQERFRNLNKEYAQLEDVVAGFLRFQQVTADLAAVLEMLEGDDAEMRAMAWMCVAGTIAAGSRKSDIRTASSKSISETDPSLWTNMFAGFKSR